MHEPRTGDKDEFLLIISAAPQAILLLISLLGFAGISAAATRNVTDPARSNQRPKSLTDQVRHELVMLPYLGVFDDLGFTIEDSNTVVLSGQVVRPVLKSEAEAAVRRIEGISKVVDNTAYHLDGVSADGSGQVLALFELDGYPARPAKPAVNKMK